VDASTRKRLLRDRERCLRWAAAMSGDPVRGTLLNLVRLYEAELALRYRTADCIADSRELLVRVDAVLDRRKRKPMRPAGR
jgi:hypothetical protein